MLWVKLLNSIGSPMVRKNMILSKIDKKRLITFGEVIYSAVGLWF